jgi:hypothetical protein
LAKPLHAPAGEPARCGEHPPAKAGSCLFREVSASDFEHSPLCSKSDALHGSARQFA